MLMPGGSGEALQPVGDSLELPVNLVLGFLLGNPLQLPKQPIVIGAR